MVNTANICSDLPDLNTVNNQNGFNLVVNALDLDSVPLDDLNILPYTFPSDIVPKPGVTPGVPLGSGGSGGSGYNGGSSPGPSLGPNPGSGPSKPSSQLGRDIAGVRGAVSSGNIAENVPEWNPSSSQNNKIEDGMPWWIFLLIGSLFVLGALAVKYHTTISEYIISTLAGIINAIYATYLYLSYLGGMASEWLISEILAYGGYINAILPDLSLIPLAGVDIFTGIGLAVDVLIVEYPSLEPILGTVADILRQYTYYQIAENINKVI